MISEAQFEIKTPYGKFIFKITGRRDRNTEQYEDYTINLGTKNKKCVQLSIPSVESNKTEGYLMWVEAYENCSLETYIERGLAQHMVLLAIRLARMLNPNLQRINLTDTSSFECQLPDGKQKVPMKLFYIAFHQSTWYEYFFGAKQKKGHDEYLALKENFYKSSYKPERFYFVNEELQNKLEPLYNSTENWYEFFEKISEKYGRRKCGIVYPWLLNALSSIFESSNQFYDNTEWYIDLENNNKLKQIEILSLDTQKGGGKKGTLKKRRQRRFTYSRTHMFPHIRKIQEWNYKAFIIGTNEF